MFINYFYIFEPAKHSLHICLFKNENNISILYFLKHILIQRFHTPFSILFYNFRPKIRVSFWYTAFNTTKGMYECPYVKIKRHQPTRNMGSHRLKNHTSKAGDIYKNNSVSNLDKEAVSFLGTTECVCSVVSKTTHSLVWNMFIVRLWSAITNPKVLLLDMWPIVLGRSWTISDHQRGLCWRQLNIFIEDVYRTETR